MDVERYVHPEGGFALDLPAELERRDDVPGALLVARDPHDPPSGFRPNLTVVVEQLAEPLDAGAHLEASLATQAEALHDWQLLDVEPTALGERPTTRTLGHHADGGIGVVAEQWRVLDGRLAWIVTASCAAIDYDLVADPLRASAESFRLAGPSRPAEGP